MDPTDQPDIIGIGESGDAVLQVGELLMSCPLEVADEVQGVHLEPLAADAVPTAAGEPPLVGMTEIAAVYGAPSEGFWAIRSPSKGTTGFSRWGNCFFGPL